MFERPVLVSTRGDPRTAVRLIDVHQRNPQGEVLLRLDERVAVVLMPGKLLFLRRFFVDRLIPIEPYVGTDQVMANLFDRRVHRKIAKNSGLAHEMRREGDDVGRRNAHPATLFAQPGLAPGLQRIDGRDYGLDLGLRKNALEERKTLTVEVCERIL